MIYLDTAATSPVHPEVLRRMTAAGAVFANPSSTHEPGRQAAELLAAARGGIASALGCRASEVVLTSGGTEADNLAVKGIVLASPRGRHIVTTPLEHEAVRASIDYLRRHHGADVTVLPAGTDGTVSPADLARSLRADTALVTVVHGSNEIGTLQPVAELAAVARAEGVPFHTDAVQSAGWAELGLNALGVDAISISGHKLGTPKGLGALILRAGIPLEPLMHGGGQERGRRSGTEDVAGAVGLATALGLSAATRAAAAGVARARDTLIDGVLARVPGSVLTGSRTRLPNHASFCFPGTAGEAVLLELERRGVTCSSGSACAAGRDEPSPILLELGYAPDVARTAVRFTLDAGATHELALEVIDHVVDAVTAVSALRTR